MNRSSKLKEIRTNSDIREINGILDNSILVSDQIIIKPGWLEDENLGLIIFDDESKCIKKLKDALSQLPLGKHLFAASIYKTYYCELKNAQEDAIHDFFTELELHRSVLFDDNVHFLLLRTEDYIQIAGPEAFLKNFDQDLVNFKEHIRIQYENDNVLRDFFLDMINSYS